MMADFDVLRAERKDNSGGKTMFGFFLLISVAIIKHLYKFMNIRQGANLHILNVDKILFVRVLSELAFNKQYRCINVVQHLIDVFKFR